ncbi:MAG: GNAT family N-acetyltransferase [Anaerolineae bacterium]|nr:GNAT family N-acetyltransferase [Anaerolineae bacterium]
MSLAHTLEDITNRALPARITLDYDGWLLRATDSRMRRANSIQPYGPSTLPLAEKIDYCEAFYRERERRIVYKMISAIEQPALADALIARGYVEDCLMSVQICDLGAGAAPTLPDGLALDVRSQADEDWQVAILGLHDPAEHGLMATPSMYAAIEAPIGCFRLTHRDETVAMGFAVLERGWLGLYSLIVAPDQRGRGFGSALVGGMLAWGARQGAQSAYLQVLWNNVPALRLYSSYGFREVYRTWYLQRDE